jgi:hypothetical protein
MAKPFAGLEGHSNEGVEPSDTIENVKDTIENVKAIMCDL